MKIINVTDNLVVFVSSVWQTTCTAFADGDDALLVDSPVLPIELDELIGALADRDVTVCQLMTTHADWDHLFSPFAFPELPLLAADTTVTSLRNGRQLKWNHSQISVFDEFLYIERAPMLHLEEMQPVSPPTSVSVGKTTVNLFPTAGHTPDGLAILIDAASTLICGDYLSPVEIPKVRHTIDAYLDTLDVLEELLSSAETVVPGHGLPMTAESAARILHADREYLVALSREGEKAPLPRDRDNGQQRRVHLLLNAPGEAGARNWSIIDPGASNTRE